MWFLRSRFAAIALTAALIGCSGQSSPRLNDVITSKEVSGVWPLAIEPVSVNCGDGKTTIFLEGRGQAFPVNQAARNRPEAYTGQLPVQSDETGLYKADPALAKYGNLHYPISSVLSVAINRCKAAGLSAL